jgi:hypothetical protein
VFLLRYQRDGEPRVVLIAHAYSVAHARMLAAGLEPGTYVDGRPLDQAAVKRLPAWAVGRVLTVKDPATVAGGKKQPAPSVRRRGVDAN